jgi:hypothetical protein
MRAIMQGMRGVVLVCMCAAGLGACGVSRAAVSAHWDTLATGLELGTFRGPWETPVGDGVITILRIDPVRWELKFLCAGEVGIRQNLTAREWCERYGLVAAINAGMFATNREAHVGYLRSGAYVNSAEWTGYRSAIAFSPRRTDIPQARIFDLDEEAAEQILERYDCVAQNLRLIKRSGKNQWSEQPKRWSEAAVGEDGSGRILFIHSRSPFSMHAFNEILLSLPIGLVCAQHMEGGPEAQLFVHVGGTEHELSGSYETGFIANDDNVDAWPIPNVLGILPRNSP